MFKKSVRSHWLRGVVVITSALHAAGHGFDPHRDQYDFLGVVF